MSLHTHTYSHKREDSVFDSDCFYDHSSYFKFEYTNAAVDCESLSASMYIAASSASPFLHHEWSILPKIMLSSWATQVLSSLCALTTNGYRGDHCEDSPFGDYHTFSGWTSSLWQHQTASPPKQLQQSGLDIDQEDDDEI
jgi:hypothetical protein